MGRNGPIDMQRELIRYSKISSQPLQCQAGPLAFRSFDLRRTSAMCGQSRDGLAKSHAEAAKLPAQTAIEVEKSKMQARGHADSDAVHHSKSS